MQGLINSWCSEEEETSSPAGARTDGLTDGFSRIVERPWQMKRKLSSHSLTSSVQLTFGAFSGDPPGVSQLEEDCKKLVAPVQGLSFLLGSSAWIVI